MQQTWKTFRSAILAGICIAMGGVVYLRVGGVAGAVIFSFGLLAVVHMGMRLYTGTAGFVASGADVRQMLWILAGNIVGCLAMGAGIRHAYPEVSVAASAIIDGRLALDWASVLFLSACCGFIMTVAVKTGREGRYWPLLMGVPLFILCGFVHSIADAFYILACPTAYLWANIGAIAVFYIVAVCGNFVGCNLYRLVMTQLQYD